MTVSAWLLVGLLFTCEAADRYLPTKHGPLTELAAAGASVVLGVATFSFVAMLAGALMFGEPTAP